MVHNENYLGKSQNSDGVYVIEKHAKNNNENEIKLNSSLGKADSPFLYFSALTATLLMLAASTTLVWTSPALIKLKSNDPEINPLGTPISTIEISVLIGVPALAGLIATCTLPKFADIIGRKATLQIFGIGLLLSMIGTALSDRMYLFVIFNSFVNSFQSAIWCLIPIYITEICEDHNRGKFGCFMTLSMPMGQLYTYLVGSVFSIRDFTLINAAPIIPFLVFSYLAPESPIYSLSKGKEEECVKALRRLRKNKTSEDLETDIKNIKLSLETEVVKDKQLQIISILKLKEGRLGLFLAMLPMLVQFMSGITVIMSLLAPIFNNTGLLAGNTIAIIVGTVKVVTYFFTSLVIERTGRKPLLIISSIGAGIAMAVLGLYFYLQYINSSFLDQIQLLPLFALLVYILSYSVGLGSIPLAIVSELFPPKVRPVAVGCVTTIVGIVILVNTSSYPLLEQYIGTHWCFWIFSFNCFLGAFLISFLLPETKGKSVDEIQKILKNY